MARPARIPTIHSVVLLMTWLIDAAASGRPGQRGQRRAGPGRPGGAARARRRRRAGGGGDELHGPVPPCGIGLVRAGAGAARAGGRGT